MKVEVMDLAQGSPEWKAHRLTRFNASEAAAMLGRDPNGMTRSELMRMKFIQSEKEFSEWVQKNILDKGHEFEEIARPWAEEIIGEELFPATLAVIVQSEGDLPLSASSDGLTMAWTKGFEHKRLNKALAESLDQGVIPDSYHPQMEQNMLLSGASSWLFMASDGNRETMRHAWYLSNPKLRAEILAGWRQFAADLAAYQYQAEPEKIAGRSPASLPALHIEVTGMVTASNLAVFKEYALDVIGAIKTDLQTDEDFANAEKTVKWCGDVESRLDAAKQHALSQTASIDELFRTIDAIKEETRQKRLTLEKSVKSRKEAIRMEILRGAQSALVAHIAELDAGRKLMPVIQERFAQVMSGKKTVTGLRDAVDTELARCKIEANQVAEKIEANLAILKTLAAEHSFLFPDVASLVNKGPDDMTAIVHQRIAQHKEAEANKEQERLDAEARRQEQQAAQVAQEAIQQAQQPAPQVAAQPDTGERIKLGEICNRLGFTVTADFLDGIGFKPVGNERAAKLYRASDFPAICAAIGRHVAECSRKDYRLAA